MTGMAMTIRLRGNVLDRQGFPFWGEDRVNRVDSSLHRSNASPEHDEALRICLTRYFNAISSRYCEPFVLGSGGPPSEDERPFPITGMVSI